MEVNGPGPLNRATPIQSRPTAPPVQQAQPALPATPQDQVDISQAGRAMANLTGPSDVHQARLEQIKAAIDDGTYENQEMLTIAFNRMYGDIQGGDGQ